MKEVYEQTKVLSEQTKTKLKNLNQEKETSEEVIKSSRIHRKIYRKRQGRTGQAIQ